MKRVLLAIAVLAVMTALPCIAADVPNTGVTGQPAVGQQSDTKRVFVPEHLLMMAYHKNLSTFAHVLDKVAHKGPTVPPEVARTAVMEMRRSVDQLEKYRAVAMATMPEHMKHHEQMQKMMDQHLVTVKTHLSELEILVRNERIPSQEVLKHLEAIEESCMEVGRGMGFGKGMRGWGEMDDCDRRGMRGWHDHRRGMMPEHGKMMEEMLQRMKAQDAELSAAVASMNAATGERKVKMLADIVSRMVQQHAEMTSYMEKMMHRHMHGGGGMQHGAGGPMHPMMHGGRPMCEDDTEYYAGDCDDSEE